jgi:hypothetical protein
VDWLVSQAPDCAAFLTLTFSDDVQSAVEANRRWKSFRDGVLRRIAREWIWARERQKSGRWHYHVVVILKRPIREGYDFAAVRAGDYRSASHTLRAYWAFLRCKCPAYGFGRHQLEPVMSPKAAGAYLAKYLTKAERDARDKGVRLWGHSEGVNVPSARFSWVRGASKAFRACWAQAARLFGQRHEAHGNVLRVNWGPRWAWKLLLVMKGSPAWVEHCLVAYEGG